ncbi:MAG: nucleoside deaminase [Bacteroidales bacterium]
MDKHTKFMKEAVQLASENISKGGGPFAAVIVKDEKIISRSGNSVTLTNDPTAHAEVNAIREACRVLNTFHLEGCSIYASCEPCPMCLSAIYWARIDRVFFAATHEDAADAGFDDSLIYNEIPKPFAERKIQFTHLSSCETLHPFILWKQESNKVKY